MFRNSPVMNKLPVIGLAAALSAFSAATASAEWNAADLGMNHVEAFGNPDAATVIINTQGGPVTELESEFLPLLFPWADLESQLWINVHQTQTLPGSDFETREITFEEAKSADAQSVRWLADVVAAFKKEGRSVFVAGASFGAFMVEHLLATQGNIADGYLIAAGRLDMPGEVWSEFSEGRMVGFENGVDIVKFSAEEAGMGGAGIHTDANMARIAAGLGHNRYTELLNGMDLSNVTYIYGMVDEQVGRLSDAEIAFLREHGAAVRSVDGSHGDAIVEMAVVLPELLGI